MNFRERAYVDIEDIVNESEESDQEYVSFSSRVLVGDIDIASVYRKLCSDRRFNDNQIRKLQKSVTVQTDPNISNISPSWLLETEQLVSKLYTGLGNIINSIYYNPQSRNKHDAMKRAKLNPSGMKYFTFENGYWQSTLLPSIKIPDLIEIDRQNRSVFSEDTKRKLFYLLEVATKLRNVIPDASRLPSCENQIADDKLQPYSDETLNDQSLSEIERNQSEEDNIKNSGHNINDIDSVDDLEENGSLSGKSSVCSSEYCDVRESLKRRVKKNSIYEEMRKKHVVLDDACGSDEIPGVKVLRYAVASGVCTNAQKRRLGNKVRKEDLNAQNSKCNFSSEKTKYAAVHPDSKVLPSCSNIRLKSKIHQCDGAGGGTSLSERKKRALYDQENFNNKVKHGNQEKNFIRKNIMDLKNKYNRSTSVGLKNSHIINTGHTSREEIFRSLPR